MSKQSKNQREPDDLIDRLFTPAPGRRYVCTACGWSGSKAPRSGRCSACGANGWKIVVDDEKTKK